MGKELTNEVGLSYTKEKGFVKGINIRSLFIEGIAQGALIKSANGNIRPTLPLPLCMTSSIWALTFSIW